MVKYDLDYSAITDPILWWWSFRMITLRTEIRLSEQDYTLSKVYDYISTNDLLFTQFLPFIEIIYIRFISQSKPFPMYAIV